MVEKSRNVSIASPPSSVDIIITGEIRTIGTLNHVFILATLSFLLYYIVLGVDIYFLDISFDFILGWRHLDIERNINVFWYVVSDWNLNSHISKFRNLKLSIISFSLGGDISNWSIVLDWSGGVLGFLLLKIDFKMLCSELWLDCVLLEDVSTWNELLLNSGVFIELSGE